MNDNNFDRNRAEASGDGAQNGGEFDVYSKKYTPGEDGYAEEIRTYSRGKDVPIKRAEPSRHKASSGRTKLAAVIGIMLAVLLICCAAAFVSARVAFSYYDNLYKDYVASQEEQNQEKQTQSQNIEKNPPVAETEAETAESELLFSSDADTEIQNSQSSGVTVDGAVGDSDLSKADVVALVANSVVEITTSETLRNGLVYESGAGSGVIVNESGVIITNNHVVAGGTNISVRLTNGNVYEAKFVAADSDSDIAILKISPKEQLTAAHCGDSDKLVVGEEVLAIGNPLGLLGGTVTNGIVSAREREVTVEGETMTLLQHNAAISPGNSGGALFNMRGELIGIVNAKYSSSGAEGLGFAIPMNTVLEVYNDLIEFGYVKGKPDHGLTIVTDGYYFFTQLYITSSRYTDELRYGDRLIAIDGQTVSTVNEAYALLDRYGIGETVDITVVRSNQQITVTLEICEYTPPN